MAARIEDLALDRDLMHARFSNWRLGRFAQVTRHHLRATGHTSEVVSTALDFLHTRASVTRNHVEESEGRLFVFTQSDQQSGYRIYELLPALASDQGLLPQQVAELSAEAGEQEIEGAVEAVVDCSLAVVAEPGPAPSTGADGDSAASTNPAVQSLLLSRGHGDIVLVRRYGDGNGGEPCVSYSNTVHPLRPRLPLSGARPFVLEAACALPGGDMVAIGWAMRSKSARAAAAAEVFAITLRAEEGGSGGAAGVDLRLSIVGVQLLLRTKLPPYLVRARPCGGPAGSGPVAGAGAVEVVVGFDPADAGMEGEDDEPMGDGAGASSSAAAAAAAAAAAPGRSASAGAMDADDEGDDVDPRTLEQAAARLAHMTSEAAEGEGPRHQWADVFREGGPDGVGDMGSEPCVDVATWRLGPGGAAGTAPDKPLPPAWRLSCGAHRLLTAEAGVALAPPPAGHLEPAAQQQPLLLGVTDDVDCAVLRLGRAGEAGPGQEAGAGAAGGSAGAEAEAGGEDVTAHVLHAVSIPALSYVVAGKQYKRHLLLTSASVPPHGAKAGQAEYGTKMPLAAVLVETQRFMYLYGTTRTEEEYGRQQVVELGLEDGETVLGARLLELPGPSPAAAEGAAAAGEGAAPCAGTGAEAVVVLATQRRLLAYRLRM
ncbi:hypothetical protein HYH03_017332 [Edaphochlamys debaryana]|uniref:Uncharacterized protein n=1 Tax=Edaphochlamys debaryana TaxID=47281 RepID=A0A835XI31_9CHLO|nr:hypothetical protein HYH03_017332 [Edaphochlamys debaryana]|eukprot:KAG2483809.1 hypothetical protein HYH03_017332 [Edaphochlamys debaryana]